MNAVRQKLPLLVKTELAAANSQHPPFASIHEAYAVMLEEFEETREELEILDQLMRKTWLAVRYDDKMEADVLQLIEQTAVSAAAEAIQLAAMARKAMPLVKCETRIPRWQREEAAKYE